MIDNDDIINKSAFKWNFKEDDWFIDIIFNNPALRYKIFIIKDYSASTINSIVFETLNLIHNYRTELEKNSKMKWLESNQQPAKIPLRRSTP